MKSKHIIGKVDYDNKYDILRFKIIDSKYDHSIEFDNIIVDLDPKKFIIGVQILDASKFLNTTKSGLMNVSRWKYRTKVHDDIIELRIVFNVFIRNKIIEKNPIILQQSDHSLPNSELVCTASV